MVATPGDRVATPGDRVATPGDMTATQGPVASPLAPFLDGGATRARFEVRTTTPSPLEHVEGLLAGAAQRDITPPPGLPKAGYSSNAHDGSGFRTRLRARVVHLRSGTTSLAIVQCDLLGGSSVLQHLVAQRIAGCTDIPLAGLMIGATHTHAGPGQFLGTDFYNRFASNRAGFDPRWAQFLVERISEAVIEAFDTRAPARMAFGRSEVWGLTRNRSLDPYVHNETVQDVRQEPQRKYVAVNPFLELLRVDRLVDGSSEPLAAAVVFSVHGTGVSQHAHEYHADLWAYLVGELGDRVEELSGTRPVVGAIEGTHADVAPNLRPGLAGHLEAQRVGRGIGAEAAALWDALGSQLTDQVVLGAGLREVDLDSSSAVDGIALPDRAAVGAALVAGATENTTPILHLLPPFRAGSPKSFGRSGPQGEKWVLGSRLLQPAILPRKSFPRVLPVQVLRVGPVTLVGLPFEVTTESGRRIVAAVGDATGAAEGRVVVTSVANEYSGYVTTAEEYTRQFYEGGHTLYGPNTLAFLSAHAARLAVQVQRDGVVSEPMAVRTWDTKVRHYLARPSTSTARRRVLGPAVFVDPTATEDGFWELRWRDLPPGDLDWHEPLVRVEADDDRDAGAWRLARHLGRRVDDQGWELEITHLGEAPGDSSGTVHEYRVRWFDPELRAGRRHRFVLLDNRGRPEVASDPFD
jgi:neutral ceramidase